ncbi:FxSxx-COOH system tetratricopeptide repeat protein [Dactylosporangium sp. NPDC049140]|uniref:FxSxx-COOH system tetratricopeptide repeat protein n=1 Tax=Dactylosporangium sp. NPDC049140 TaxID=3155647 RepID=UPI0034025875
MAPAPLNFDRSQGIQIGDYNQQDVTVVQIPATALPAPDTVEPPAGTHNLPEPGAGPFVGRADDLAELADRAATRGGPIGEAIHGLGGVGKSELALRYARADRDRYRVIWWITADGRDDIALGLAALTRRLHPAPSYTDPESWAVGWLQSHDDWLLILDNVEDVADVERLLGAVRGHGRVLITTRRNLGSAIWTRLGLRPVELSVLEPADSAELVVRLTGRPDEADEARLLADDLGGLPLGLEQAAAYIAQRDITIAEYRRRLAEQPGRMHATAPEGGRPDRIVQRVWAVTMETVVARSHLAYHLMGALAFLAPEPVPVSFLSPLAKGDELAVEDGLATLVAYSMVRRSGGDVQVHRLVQAVVRAQLAQVTHPEPEGFDDAALHQRYALELVLLVMPLNPFDNTAWPWWSRFLPHVIALARSLRPGTMLLERRDDAVVTADAGYLLDRSATYLLSQGRFASAVDLFDEAVSRQRLFGPDDVLPLSSRFNLADACRRAGRYDRAIALFVSLAADSARIMGAQHQLTLDVRDSLAGIYGEVGRWPDALTLLRATAATRAEAFGPDSDESLRARSRIAAVLSQAGRHAEAIADLEQVVRRREQLHGAEHPATLRAGADLAGMQTLAHRHDEAVALYETVLDRYEGLFGADDARTLIARHNLAFALHRAGRMTEATDRFEALLPDLERVLGARHPSTLDAREVLADVYWQTGRDVEGAEALMSVLKAFTDVYGWSHPRTMTARTTVAGHLLMGGLYAAAVPILEALLSDYEATSPADHPHRLATRDNLAAAYLYDGRLDKAIPLVESVYADYRRVYGDAHPDTVVCRNNLAQARLNAGRTEEAIALLVENERICADAFGPAHPTTMQAREALAHARGAR